MADQLSATDWLDQGLKTLAKSGFTALKADPLAKQLGVSRGSFYWHFADVDAFHAAILARWREIATEQVIVNLEAQPDGDALPHLLRSAFTFKPELEVAVRSWATHDGAARKTVQAIDQRRLSYIAQLLRQSGATVVETTLRYEDFVGADEIFSTGNYSKVSPVTRIDERSLQPGPFYRRTRELYWEFAHARAA